MKRVYKYPLLLMDEQEVEVPINRELLSIQVQDDRIVMWYLVDEDADNDATIKLHIVPTGMLCVDDDWYHLETVQMGLLVWHLFQEYQTDWEL